MGSYFNKSVNSKGVNEFNNSANLFKSKLDKKIKTHKYKITYDLEIKFINSFNEELDATHYELFMKYDHIIFGFSFNNDVRNKFPSTVKYIKFGHNFNQSINFLINPNEIEQNKTIELEELVFGEHFNYEVNNLPPHLKKITFGTNFNQNVKNLPLTIEYIQFGTNFNQNVDYLPNSLKHVIFGEKFNQQINDLPSFLNVIELDKNFDYEITSFPYELTKLILDKQYLLKNQINLKNKSFEIFIV